MPKAPPLVYVEWLDHCEKGEDYAWIDIEALDTELPVCRSVGWMVGETDTAIMVAHTWSDPQVCGPFLIVKGAIIRQVVLRVPRKSAKVKPG